MKKSTLKFVIFYVILFFILFVNSFVSSILNLQRMVLFLVVILILFRLLFGFEKDRHRYTKDIFVNILIILLVSYLLFYISGLFIGFMRTEMQYSTYGLTHFLLPYIAIILLQEFLRYQMVQKASMNSKWLIVICLFFTMLDASIQVNSIANYSRYEIFLVFSLVLLPSLSRNITATYLCKKVGYKPNWLWMLVVSLYSTMLPIVPNTGEYVLSMIRLLFPLVILYHVYSFFEKRKNDVPLSYDHKRKWVGALTCLLFIGIIIYFTSGYFRYYVVAIATGSMTPNINKGDVVLLDQRVAYVDMHVGDVLVYKYEDKVIVHRIEKILNDQEQYYFYTKGDANNMVDNYVIDEDMVIGIVKLRVPYIGLPTVWLNELF